MDMHMTDNQKKTCSYCGAEVEATDLYCLECGNALKSVASPEGTEKGVYTQPVCENDRQQELDEINAKYVAAQRQLADKEKELSDCVSKLRQYEEQDETSKNVSSKGRTILIISTITLALVSVFLLAAWFQAADDASYEQTRYNIAQRMVDELSTELEYEQTRYNDAQKKVDELSTELEYEQTRYNNAQKMVDELSTELEWVRPLIEYNALNKLYRVDVNYVYNSDENGEKIGDELELASIDHLGIDITVSAPEQDNRWKRPLNVNLLAPGGEVNNTWRIDPSIMSQTDESAGWRMWTKVEESGTYLAVFYCDDVVVAQHEFEIS